MTDTQAAALITELANLNQTISNLSKFLMHGPDFEQLEFQSAEEDNIDDDVGVYDLHGQAQEEFIKNWRAAGYPGDVFKSD